MEKGSRQGRCVKEGVMWLFPPHAFILYVNRKCVGSVFVSQYDMSPGKKHQCIVALLTALVASLYM